MLPRILHVGNPAEVASHIRDAMARAGLADSLVVETHNNRLNFSEDLRFSWDWADSKVKRLERRIAYIFLLRQMATSADVVHIHASGELTVSLARWARRKGKAVVRHFHGEELRTGDPRVEIQNSDAILVSTPDLLHRLSDAKESTIAKWVPNPCPPERDMPQRRLPYSKPVKIAHSYLKDAQYAFAYGTDAVRKTVAELNMRGHEVVLDEVTGLPHGEALTRYREADIAVDKLRIGWYGMFSVECMMMGIPTLAGISAELAALSPPVLPTSEQTLTADLERLVEDPAMRSRVGADQAHRVREFHSPERVAREISDVYRRILE